MRSSRSSKTYAPPWKLTVSRMVVADSTISDGELDRRLVQNLADFDEDKEVRDAAATVLATNDPAQITDFLNHGVPVYRKAATDRKAEQAADNRAVVTQWTKTGGPIARQRATAALASKDDDTIADFVAVGKAVADVADAKAVEDAAKPPRRSRRGSSRWSPWAATK